MMAGCPSRLPANRHRRGNAQKRAERRARVLEGAALRRGQRTKHHGVNPGLAPPDDAAPRADEATLRDDVMREAGAGPRDGLAHVADVADVVRPVTIRDEELVVVREQM